MGLLGDVNVDLGSALTGIGTLAKDIRSAITGEIAPEKKAELEMLAAQIESKAIEAQAHINAIEAAHPNAFVSGWRPAVGWVCAGALAYNFILRHLIVWGGGIICTAMNWAPIPTPPSPDFGDLFTILAGMLGLGAMRSFEKFKGVARN